MAQEYLLTAQAVLITTGEAAFSTNFKRIRQLAHTYLE